MDRGDILRQEYKITEFHDGTDLIYMVIREGSMRQRCRTRALAENWIEADVFARCSALQGVRDHIEADLDAILVHQHEPIPDTYGNW